MTPTIIYVPYAIAKLKLSVKHTSLHSLQCIVTHNKDILRPNEQTIGDACWLLLNSTLDPNFISTKNPTPDRELTGTEEAYNNEIKKIRIVVENVFSQLKQWAICSDVLRLHVTLDGDAEHSHHRVWAVVSALHNLYGPDLRQAILVIDD